MPRRRGMKVPKGSPSKFWSMKENPEGASIGNLVSNVKRFPAETKSIVKAVKTGTVKDLVYSDMNPMGKKLMTKLGYKPKK